MQLLVNCASSGALSTICLADAHNQIYISQPGGELLLRASEGDLIEQAVLKNLLSAQKRIAETGTVNEIIRLSKYLLSLAKQRKNILTQVVTEDDEQGSDQPI